jgi:hypothetical protein
MAFKELLISYAPDADKIKLLCPGFTHAVLLQSQRLLEII